MPIQTKQIRKSLNRTRAFTLIELLVVITILAILTAVLIPNLRTITKDRNARETARKVASLMATASQRAETDGVAGIVLFRNPSYLIDSDGDGTLNAATDFQYAVTSLALLRKVPNYTGDFTGSTATVSAPFTIQIPLPIEQTSLSLVSAGDRIAINNNNFDYLIDRVQIETATPTMLTLTLNPSEHQDPSLLPTTVGLPFSVRRSPRVLKSSRLDLPGDFIIDLRFSGFNGTDSVVPGGNVVANGENTGFDSTVFEPIPQRIDDAMVAAVPFNNAPIALLFNDDGGIDQLGQVTTQAAIQYSYTNETQGPLFLLITEYDLDTATDPTVVNPLASDTNLWVTVSNVSGTANVGHNNPFPVAGVSLANLSARYNGTFTDNTQMDIDAMRADRGVFNAIVSASRAASVDTSVAQ